MISRHLARDQVETFKWMNKHLCSAYDPKKEAREWVNTNQDKLINHHTVFVLGVGCGYHLIELSTRFPHLQIIAIDFIDAIVHASRELQSLQAASIEYLCKPDVEAIKINRHFLNHLKKKYAVLCFLPSCHHSANQFHTIESLLIGRELFAFQFLTQQRNDLQLLRNALVAIDDSRELISIKKINFEHSDLAQSKEWLKLKILRELVV